MPQRNTILTLEEFIEKAKFVHKERYDYSKVIYRGRHKIVTIRCLNHGNFLQSPGEHFKGKGCRFCARNVTSTTEDFITKAQKIHGSKYDYSKVTYKNAHIGVIIICPIHGEFKQAPHDHLKGKKCKFCGYEKRKNNNGFKWKTFRFPSGRVEKVQGYEPKTLERLLKSISEEKIKVKHEEKPVILYDWNGSLHRYHPDCFVEPTLLVETKSTHYWFLELEKNKAKIMGSLKSGYDVRVVVWDRYENLYLDKLYTKRLN